MQRPAKCSSSLLAYNLITHTLMSAPCQVANYGSLLAGKPFTRTTSLACSVFFPLLLCTCLHVRALTLLQTRTAAPCAPSLCMQSCRNLLLGIALLELGGTRTKSDMASNLCPVHFWCDPTDKLRRKQERGGSSSSTRAPVEKVDETSYGTCSPQPS